MDTSLSIMCFTWNAAGLRLCETMSQTKANQNRQGLFFKREPCLAPDFFEGIRTTIITKKPMLVVMTTQNETSDETYFHAELLPSAMPEIGYSLLKRDKLNNVGDAASGFLQGRVKTGQPTGSALRMSIYVRLDEEASFRSQDRALANLFSNDGQLSASCQQGDRMSGAIASYVWHPEYGKSIFIAIDLPVGSNALRVGKTMDYSTYRVATKSANTLCLINLLHEFVDRLPDQSKPDHIFLLGDMNYDIVVPGKKNVDVVAALSGDVTLAAVKKLQDNDELKKAMTEEPLLGFKEGVSGEGPLFIPTWRLARGRGDRCSPNQNTTKISVDCFDNPNSELGGVGWHDRILYKERMTSSYITHCTEYNRIDINNMHESTNAGVTAYFELKLLGSS